MQFLTEDNRWPAISDRAELSAVVERIALAIQEFEECWRRGALKVALGFIENQKLVGDALLKVYCDFSVKPEESLCRHRQQWMQNLLDEFADACAEPLVVFKAKSIEPDKLLVSFNGSEVLVRSDQVVNLRFWRVGIEPEDSQQAVHLANSILLHALDNLTDKISWVNKLCRSYSTGKLKPDSIRWTTRTRGAAFERLIADILNEDKQRAWQAPLWEDLFEWTDLRVKYSDLRRRYGARVQVKLIGNEDFEKQEIAFRRRTELYVILSPVQLARHVAKCLEAGPNELLGDEFWRCIPGEPADTAELALVLERIFLSAIANATAHPLGPMAKVPAAIRRLVQAYVRAGAFSSTEQVRAAIAQQSFRFESDGHVSSVSK